VRFFLSQTLGNSLSLIHHSSLKTRIFLKIFIDKKNLMKLKFGLFCFHSFKIQILTLQTIHSIGLGLKGQTVKTCTVLYRAFKIFETSSINYKAR